MESSIPTGLTAAEGRSFGFTVGGAFLVAAGVLVWRGHATGGVVSGGLGTVLVLWGLVGPSSLGPVYRGWMALALLISRVTTPLILGIIFLGMVLPIGLLRRWISGNPMKQQLVNDSYWIPRERLGGKGSMEEQF